MPRGRLRHLFVPFAFLLSLAAPSGAATVGYWRFEEGSGSTANDSSASDNDGTLLGNAAFVSSVPFPTIAESANVFALTLDGTGDLVEVPDDPSLDLSGPFTIEAFVRPTAADETIAGIVVKRNIIGNSPAYGLIFGSADGVRAAAQVASPGSIATASSPVPLNQWSHVAGVWNGTTLSLYVNAQFISSVNGSGAVEVSAQVLRIGSYGIDFAGQIDEVRVSNVVLQPQQFLYSPVFSDGFETGNTLEWS